MRKSSKPHYFINVSTDLNVAKSFAQSLLDKEFKHLSPAQKEALKKRIRNAKSHAEINSILNANAMTSNKAGSANNKAEYSQQDFNKVCDAVGLKGKDGNPLSTTDKQKFYDLCVDGGITTKESMVAMLAMAAHESPKGAAEGSGSGAGYLQITGEEFHKNFLAAMGDSTQNGKSKYETSSYISKKYPMESAIWYWTQDKGKLKDANGSGTSINDFIASHRSTVDNVNLMLAASYAVKGWTGGINGTSGTSLSRDERIAAQYAIQTGNYNTYREGTPENNDKQLISKTKPPAVVKVPDGWYTKSSGHKGRKPLFETGAAAINLG